MVPNKSYQSYSLNSKVLILIAPREVSNFGEKLESCQNTQRSFLLNLRKLRDLKAFLLHDIVYILATAEELNSYKRHLKTLLFMRSTYHLILLSMNNFFVCVSEKRKPKYPGEKLEYPGEPLGAQKRTNKLGIELRPHYFCVNPALLYCIHLLAFFPHRLRYKVYVH